LSSGSVPQFDREAQPYLGGSSSNEVLNVIKNELSNPQFAVVNFDTSNGAYTYNVSAVTDSVISIAPDWDLVVSAPGAGTITLTQIDPAGSLNIVTNPGTILSISSTGLSKLHLRQRLLGSPNLWGSGFIASTFVAKTYSGTAVTLNLYYSQSDGTVINQQFLPAASLLASGAYKVFNGTVEIPASTSTNTFPSAYIDIYFDIPLGIQVDITSVMVAFTGDTSINNMAYEEESYARQIDHLYHDAYPVVPVGTIIDFFGFGTPTHYLPCDGAAINRVTNQLLFRALTKKETVTLTSGNATFTVANGAIYAAGMPIEGTGVPAATTILSISTNTITMSANATVSGSQSLTFFSVGNGDGSTTFNTPNLQGKYLAGSGGTLFATKGASASGGAASVSLTTDNLPAHTHPVTNWTPGGTPGFPAIVSNVIAPGSPINYNTGVNTTAHTDVAILPPTVLSNKFIRFE
jgi:microcystin-dependent protein